MRHIVMAFSLAVLGLPVWAGEEYLLANEMAQGEPPAVVADEGTALSSEDAEAAAQQSQAEEGWVSECDAGCVNPWLFNFTQTADYGTSLALPISLTPANTLLAPVGNLGATSILNIPLVNSLGIADNLGLVPGVIPNNPAIAVFPDDFQFQTTAGLQRQWNDFAGGTLTASGAYYQSLHPVVHQLDLYAPSASLQYARQLTDRLVGTVDYTYSYYFLDNISYVTQNRAGAGLLLRHNDCWDFQVRGDFADANFRPTPFLNSKNWSGKIEAIRYLSDRNDYLTMGYAIGYSDAISRSFSYQVNNVYIGGRWKFGDCDRNEFRTTFSYGVYDFFGTDPIDTTVSRQDNIFTLNFLLGRQINDYWTVFAAYTLLDSQSNVSRQNYDSDLISLGATFTR